MCTGATADPSVTGKPLGGDLRAGKRTLLVSLALGRRGSEVERLLSSVLGNPQASSAEVQRALSALDACGARAEVEERISVLARDASDALDAGDWPPDARGLLEGLRVVGSRPPSSTTRARSPTRVSAPVELVTMKVA